MMASFQSLYLQFSPLEQLVTDTFTPVTSSHTIQVSDEELSQGPSNHQRGTDLHKRGSFYH